LLQRKETSLYDDELPEWKALPDVQRVKKWYMLSSVNAGKEMMETPDEI